MLSSKRDVVSNCYIMTQLINLDFQLKPFLLNLSHAEMRVRKPKLYIHTSAALTK